MDNSAGASAPQPAVLAAAAAAEFAGVTSASTASPAPGYAVLTRAVAGVGAAGQVVCARGARIAAWLSAGDARSATAAEVELAAPFHSVIED